MNDFILDKLLPINIWEEIALFVQRFNISNGSEKEKEKNLLALIKFLKQKGYNLSKEEGVYLINAIYNINCELNYKKAYFYEQICALKDLKVNKIAFIPNNYLKNIISLTDKNNKSIILKNAYTNGIFNIRKWESNGFKYYSIINLENANYVIVKIMDINENKLVRVEAYLKNFNGEYPNIKEIRKFKYVKLLEIKDKLYQENYSLLSRDEISCKKNLSLKLGKKKKYNQYYYEKR